MSIFKYTEKEYEINKVLKHNQDVSMQLLHETALSSARREAEQNIAASAELLKSLGYCAEVSAAQMHAEEAKKAGTPEHPPVLEDWDSLVTEANHDIPGKVLLEDVLSPEEINAAFRELEEINNEFSRETSIVNKTDLSFLAIAAGLQTAKALLFPYVAEKYGYGKSFDASERLAHNDSSIEKEHREANDRFRDKNAEKHKNGYWINILYQTPPYDITRGSTALGLNMEGKYHRLHTLGHDPVLGWLFGTANILTDIVTMNDFRSYRVIRKPSMVITPNAVGIGTMLQESIQVVKDDWLNLPAAIFAQAQHLKSDVYTKTGLPVPLLSAFHESYASNLYKNQYDALCLERDAKIVGTSYLLSLLIDTVIGLVHGLFRRAEESQKLYEVRTRKILLVSNSIASTSSIINACITKNRKNLDIGSLLTTVSHLFTDIRFITRIKHEFIENEISKRLQAELEEIDSLYYSL